MNASTRTWLTSFERTSAFIALRNIWYGNKIQRPHAAIFYDYNFSILIIWSRCERTKEILLIVVVPVCLETVSWDAYMLYYKLQLILLQLLFCSAQ